MCLWQKSGVIVQRRHPRLTPASPTPPSQCAIQFIPETKQKLTCVCVPETNSRGTAPSRPDLIRKALYGNLGGASVVVASGSEDDAVAVALALAKCLPALCLKSSSGKEDAAPKDVNVTFASGLGEGLMERLQHVADGVAAAQMLVDAPPNFLDCETYEAFVQQLVKDVPGVQVKVIKGPELEAMGMGGIYGVGKAAASAPRMIILSHGAGDAPSACLVGKGIIFDTGGLSIKVPPNQQGMKMDMGGSSAMLGAFTALAKMGGIGRPLHCVLCVAENAVNERALRNDDVITMYSGVTVEINNTDAEGRLVLGDGVAYCAKHLSPELVVDMATLTGAQGISTGSLHAALYCNDEDTEAAALKAGIASGDYAYPILYAPDLHLNEFKSQVADMKNSVKNRVNAQCSCAGSFIFEQLFRAGYDGKALHIDMAFPAMADERATGYGVGLICKLLKGI